MEFSSSCWFLVSAITYIHDSVVDMQPVLYPTYSSVLDNRSAIYAREVCLLPNYFYEALVFNVSIAGDYTFWSHSDINTYGYLYHDVFNPLQPATNRIISDDAGCNNKQFHFTRRLHPNTTYILVVTTYRANAIGRFSIISGGPTAIQFFRSSEYSDCEVSNSGYWMI
jgi:hypothetical protein